MAFDMSRAAFGGSDGLERVQRIPLDRIRGNEKNFYSMEGLRELAESIRMVGLLDPVCVLRDGPDGYRLISGHRRYAAYQLLREEAEGYDAIPAMVLEQMGDLSETFALITANATARELSYAEKCRQEQMLRETLEAMRAAGMEVPKNLGQYMAEQLGTSRNEVSRMHSVNERLIPEARAELDRGNLTAQQAYEMSRRPEEEQRAAVSNLDTEKTAPKRGFAVDDEEIDKRVAVMKAANHLLDGLLERIGTLRIVDRSTGIMELKAGLKRRGSFGDSTSWLTAQDVTLAVTNHGDKMRHITPSDLWDAMSIAAMRRCREMSKLDTAAEQGGGTAWRSADPEKEGTYVCMVRRPNGSEAAVLLEWRKEWQLNGMAVGSTYKVRKWTEVPE